MKLDYDDKLFGESASCAGTLALNLGVGLALCALLLLMASGIGVRLGAWHFRTGFTILKYAAYGGGAAILMTLTAIVLAIKEGKSIGLVAVLVAVAMAIAAVGIPWQLKRTAERLPRIHDISTDLDNPPAFVAVPPLRRGDDNPVAYGGAEVADKQRLAYPDLKPAFVELPADQAFARALAAAHRLHWEIVAEEPAEGRIEATDMTFWFGFKDDIVIRLTPAGNRTRVDIRSLSRVGVSDVGTNARRVRDYLRMLSSLSP